MNYVVMYGISCGVSQGFGLKYPDYIERTERIDADNNLSALIKIAKKAVEFSFEYLSNPDDDATIVTVNHLYDKNNRLLNQKEILKAEGFTSIRRFEWKGDKLVTSCSSIEHLLSLNSKKNGL